MFVMGWTNIVPALRGHCVRISRMSARDRVNHAGSVTRRGESRARAFDHAAGKAGGSRLSEGSRREAGEEGDFAVRMTERSQRAADQNADRADHI